MTRDEIRRQVVREITSQVGLCPDETRLGDDTRLDDDLGVDSLDAVELTMTFEDLFDIPIPDEDADTMNTVGDVVTYLERRLGEPKP